MLLSPPDWPVGLSALGTAGEGRVGWASLTDIVAIPALEYLAPQHRLQADRALQDGDDLLLSPVLLHWTLSTIACLTVWVSEWCPRLNVPTVFQIPDINVCVYCINNKYLRWVCCKILWETSILFLSFAKSPAVLPWLFFRLKRRRWKDWSLTDRSSGSNSRTKYWFSMLWI